MGKQTRKVQRNMVRNQSHASNQRAATEGTRLLRQAQDEQRQYGRLAQSMVVALHKYDVWDPFLEWKRHRFSIREQVVAKLVATEDASGDRQGVVA